MICCRLREETDEQMARLAPTFPKSHGRPWVGDRRGLSGMIFVNRNGLRWRDAKGYGCHKALCNAGSGEAQAATHDRCRDAMLLAEAAHPAIRIRRAQNSPGRLGSR